MNKYDINTYPSMNSYQLGKICTSLHNKSVQIEFYHGENKEFHTRLHRDREGNDQALLTNTKTGERTWHAPREGQKLIIDDYQSLSFKRSANDSWSVQDESETEISQGISIEKERSAEKKINIKDKKEIEEVIEHVSHLLKNIPPNFVENTRNKMSVARKKAYQEARKKGKSCAESDLSKANVARSIIRTIPEVQKIRNEIYSFFKHKKGLEKREAYKKADRYAFSLNIIY